MTDGVTRILGLSIVEWSVLLTALAALIDAIRLRFVAGRETKKMRAVIQAVEATAAAHPEAVKLTKRLVKAKATELGVEFGPKGLSADVKKETKA